MNSSHSRSTTATSRRPSPSAGPATIAPDITASVEARAERLREEDYDLDLGVLGFGLTWLPSERLTGHDLYVTLEPCPMCAGAISFARIGRLYFGATDPKSGGVTVGARVFRHPQCHHAPEVYDGIGAEAAADLLRRFFGDRR